MVYLCICVFVCCVLELHRVSSSETFPRPSNRSALYPLIYTNMHILSFEYLHIYLHPSVTYLPTYLFICYTSLAGGPVAESAAGFSARGPDAWPLRPHQHSSSTAGEYASLPLLYHSSAAILLKDRCPLGHQMS